MPGAKAKRRNRSPVFSISYHYSLSGLSIKRTHLVLTLPIHPFDWLKKQSLWPNRVPCHKALLRLILVYGAQLLLTGNRVAQGNRTLPPVPHGTFSRAAAGASFLGRISRSLPEAYRMRDRIVAEAGDMPELKRQINRGLAVRVKKRAIFRRVSINIHIDVECLFYILHSPGDVYNQSIRICARHRSTRSLSTGRHPVHMRPFRPTCGKLSPGLESMEISRIGVDKSTGGEWGRPAASRLNYKSISVKLL